MPDAPEALEPRTLQQRIGGRWAISWQAFLLTSTLGLLALVAGEAQALSSTADLARWLGLYVVATAAAGGLVLVINYTVFRNRRQRCLPLWSVVVFHAVAASCYSVIMAVGAQRLGLPTDLTPVQRVGVNAVIAMWWGPTLSYFLDFRQQFLDTRRALLADAVSVELAQAQQQELARRMRAELLEEVNAELVAARSAVDAMLRTLSEVGGSAPGAAAIEWKEAAELLRGTATDAVRPLSQRIWKQAEERVPKEPWWAVPANIVAHQPLRPLAFALLDVLGTAAQLVTVFGVGQAVALLVVGLAITVPLMVGANVLMQRYPHRHVQVFLGALVALQISVLLRALLREQFIPGTAPMSWIVVQVLATILVVLVTSGFGAWRDRETSILANLRSDLEHERVVAMARTRQVAGVAREMSQVLHGAVQSKLLACAMLLDSEDADRTSETANAVLRQALEILANPLQEPLPGGSVVDEIHRKVALWEGFCEFDVRIALEASGLGAGDIIGRIVEEAITNSLRHGGATSIAIEVDVTSEGDVRIVVVDNGTGVHPGAPGLGSAYLQQATVGRWSLAPAPGGARLEALVTPGAA